MHIRHLTIIHSCILNGCMSAALTSHISQPYARNLCKYALIHSFHPLAWPDWYLFLQIHIFKTTIHALSNRHHVATSSMNFRITSDAMDRFYPTPFKSVVEELSWLLWHLFRFDVSRVQFSSIYLSSFSSWAAIHLFRSPRSSSSSLRLMVRSCEFRSPECTYKWNDTTRKTTTYHSVLCRKPHSFVRIAFEQWSSKAALLCGVLCDNRLQLHMIANEYDLAGSRWHYRNKTFWLGAHSTLVDYQL